MKTILIDIDGTLLDSQKRKDEFFSLAINKLNEKYSKFSFNLYDLLQKVDKMFHLYPNGRRNDPKLIFTEFLNSFRLSPKVFDSAMIDIMQLYWDILKKSRPIPGASSFLHNLIQNCFDYMLYSDGTSEETNFKLQLFPKDFFPNHFLH